MQTFYYPYGITFKILCIKWKLYLLRVSTRGESRIKSETKWYLLRVSTRGEYRIKTETKLYSLRAMITEGLRWIWDWSVQEVQDL